MKFELEYIEKLVNLVSESELTELALEDGEKAIVLRKEKEVVTATTIPVATAAPAAAAPAVGPAPAQAPEIPKTEVRKGTPITSPMVGTFYKASSPGAAPFAEVGKSVDKGSVVCIIEAMKLMNEIESEVSGKVVEICVEDGQPVEFGQVLMYVE